MVSICCGWEFTGRWTEEFSRGEGSFPVVDLPHNVKELSLHYASPSDYEGIYGYRRIIEYGKELSGKRVFLQLDGAAHIAQVFLNGGLLSEHRCGYTYFRTELTEHLKDGPNVLAVRLDSTENGSIPPFGFVIDYLTYSGLYREAWLDVKEQSFIEDVFVSTPDLKTARAAVKVEGDASDCRLSVLDGEKVLTSAAGAPGVFELPVPAAESWNVDHPRLYTLRTELFDKDGALLDTREEAFGFRTAVFKADGFYLNGEKLYIRGLNRHQNYPYVGYAATKSLQEEDARILKEELCCNAVRTSHYPQSRWFIDACDRLGLLVFTEIPGWQHIGDETWKDQAVENTREMVLQYRNHPSIVLWGVRINESQDCDDLYERTNKLARELDPSRQTSGVRYIENSHLLEDVYSYNDFSHDGTTPGCKPKDKVTKESAKPLIISEANGHMFPTKSFDNWSRRQEHALRHARVLNDSMADGKHCGTFQWCMFDYPTHKDFGSGDRVCYHGVMDAFRNPKNAAFTYASQGENAPVLEPTSSMDIGDYPAGNIGSIYVLTNGDEIKLYKNDYYVKTFKPKHTGGLKHPPIEIDDIVGDLLITQEGFPENKARELAACLSDVQKYGMANLPLKSKLRFARAMAKYKLTYDDGVALYGKYIGNWGGASTVWRFDAVKDGKVVKSVIKSPSDKLHLEVSVSKTDLEEDFTYDMAAVRVRVCDEYGNTAWYAQLPVIFELEGAADLVGPYVCTAEGGMCGTYIRTSGQSGTARLTVRTAQTEPYQIVFTIKGRQL